MSEIFSDEVCAQLVRDRDANDRTENFYNFGVPALIGGVLFLAVAAVAVPGLYSGPAKQQPSCQDAVSAAEQVTKRANVENAILSLARNSNEGATPSAYRPDSNVEQAIANVRQACFAQHAP